MSSENIPDILRFASIVSVAFPLLLYVVKVRQASRPVHLMGALAIFSALSDIVGGIYFAKGQSTVILFNSFYVVQFLLLSWFFYEILLTRKGRTTIWIGLIAYAVSFLLVTAFVQPFSEYQTLLWTISGMIMILYSISYFVYLFSSQTINDNYGFLWMNGGILYYFAFNLFLFIMSSYVLTKLESQISLLIWSFHNANNIIKNVLVGLGIASYSSEPSPMSVKH